MADGRMTRRRFVAGMGGAMVGTVLTPRHDGWAAAPTTQPATASQPGKPGCLQPGGTLALKVSYAGPRPTMDVVDCSEDPYCEALFEDSPLREEWLVLGEGDALANVFVSVTEGVAKDAAWPVPSEPVVVDQVCRFVPRVFGVRAGQRLAFHNSSQTLEVPHGYPKKNREFSLNIPAGLTREVTLDHAEVFRIKCDVHSWERAYCHVMTHPFFAVTDAKGSARISGLPRGTYTVALWHERLGVRTVTMVVDTEGGTAAEEVVFKPRRRRRR